jgi:hypothetical protein
MIIHIDHPHLHNLQKFDILRPMRSIGFPELIVILGTLLFLLLVPLALIAFIVWWFAKRKPNVIGSKSCGHCGQRIPDIGGFCPICGQTSLAP